MKKLLIETNCKKELPEKSGYYYAVIIDEHPCVVPEIVLLYYSETKTWGGLDKVICWYKEVSEREYLEKLLNAFMIFAQENYHNFCGREKMIDEFLKTL